VPTPSVLPASPPVPASPDAEASPTARTPGSNNAPSASDAKAIQAELEKAYGTRRPTVPGRPPPSAGTPSWLKGVEVVDAKPPPAGERRLGGRYGDHLHLELRSNLDSRLCGSGAVEAVLVRPYVVNGGVVLPARTRAYGQCTPHGGRFLVSFQRLRLPDGTEVHFDGVAMDAADGKPGLQATRRLAVAGSGQDSVGASVARGAAATALANATSGGSVGAQLAAGAGQTILNAPSPLSPASGEDAILLDAGAGIDVFLRSGF